MYYTWVHVGKAGDRQLLKTEFWVVCATLSEIKVSSQDADKLGLLSAVVAIFMQHLSGMPF